MKRPAFQFYPGDWQRNANLRRCSPAARGVWVDVLCLLHDSDEYGVLHWPLKEIAQAAGASLSHVKELVEKSVLKGSDIAITVPYIYTPRSGRRDGDPVTLIDVQRGPVWYSSRMVKDEHVRTIRGESSRFGEHKGESSKASPKPPFGDGSSSASTTAVNSVPIGTDGSAVGGEPPALFMPDKPGAAAPAPPAPPPAPSTARERLFAEGVPLLEAAGVSEKNARSMLAGLAKRTSDEQVVEAIEACAREGAVEPVSWLQRRLNAHTNGSASRAAAPNRFTAGAAAIFEGADHV